MGYQPGAHDTHPQWLYQTVLFYLPNYRFCFRLKPLSLLVPSSARIHPISPGCIGAVGRDTVRQTRAWLRQPKLWLLTALFIYRDGFHLFQMPWCEDSQLGHERSHGSYSQRLYETQVLLKRKGMLFCSSFPDHYPQMLYLVIFLALEIEYVEWFRLLVFERLSVSRFLLSSGKIRTEHRIETACFQTLIHTRHRIVVVNKESNRGKPYLSLIFPLWVFSWERGREEEPEKCVPPRPGTLR